MNFTLIVCTHNREQQIYHFLQNLPLNTLIKHEVEIIIIDNASTDNTLSILQDFARESPKTLKLIVSSEPQKGKVLALNKALKIAQGEYLIFTDDDCYLKEDYFDKLYEEIINSSQKIHYYGGRIDLYDVSDDSYCSSLHIKHDSIFIPAYSFIPAGHIQGANMVFWKEIVGTIGVFDPALGPHTPFRFEDIDYAARASMQGFCGKFTNKLCVYHHHGRKPASKDLLELIKKNDFSRGAYYMKLLLMGNLRFLSTWADRWMKIATVDDLKPRIRELWGFVRFFFFKLRNG